MSVPQFSHQMGNPKVPVTRQRSGLRICVAESGQVDQYPVDDWEPERIQGDGGTGYQRARRTH